MFKKYWHRITRSARGELFNPLLWPFLLSTFAYSVGFTVFVGTSAAAKSSLFVAMTMLHPSVPFIWGILGVVTILGGLTFLLFNIPPYGKFSGIMGFMLWTFVTICYAYQANFLLIFSLALPNIWFWFWQYLSLSVFRSQDRDDARTLKSNMPL